jgi:hypothetical protein
MATTSQGLRYPTSTSAVDVPTDIGNLASDVDAKLVTNNTFVTRKDGVQAVSSITASAAIGTTVTAILTLTSCVFSAGRAYSIECVGGAYGDVDGRFADFSVFKTSTAGTQYGAFYRTRCGINTKQTNCYGKIYVRRSAGTDLTTDIVLTVASDAGTVTMDAFSNRPRALVVRDVGTATAYSWAFDVT